ncbi:hypothetical protein FRC07_010499 [Ceratobasidium sp. 392]|nr:hypothetical protein FRC07_010499 [Ceratobasidium sp. 392]
MNLIRYRKTMLELKIEEVYPGRFGNLNEATYLEIGVTSAIEASSLVPDDSPVKGNVLNRLGISYWTRYKGLDNLVDLVMAIECHSQAMELPHDPTMDPNEWLYNLGSLHQRMFEQQQDPSALDASIGYQTQALAQTGPSHPLKPHILRALGDLSNYRFELLGRLADLQSAITYLEQVISLFPGRGLPGV